MLTRFSLEHSDWPCVPGHEWLAQAPVSLDLRDAHRDVALLPRVAHPAVPVASPTQAPEPVPDAASSPTPGLGPPLPDHAALRAPSCAATKGVERKRGAEAGLPQPSGRPWRRTGLRGPRAWRHSNPTGLSSLAAPVPCFLASHSRSACRVWPRKWLGSRKGYCASCRASTY